MHLDRRIVVVHVFSMNDINIAVDVNSGSINVLDDISYELLRSFDKPFTYKQAEEKLKEKFGRESIKEACDDINELVEKGLLFTAELDKGAIINKVNKYNGIKALCLHVAHDCNLMCEYCFASKGSYKVAKSLMPAQVAFKAVDFVVNNSGTRENVEIDFFGGEPLLNFDVVKETVEYAKKVEERSGKNIHFTITTNGMLLDDEKIKYINDNMDNVVISIDGRKEVHDAIRYDGAHNGTYDRILKNALKLVKERKGKSYFIRGTFTSRNLDFSKDVFHLADLGFEEISVEPVVGAGEDFHIRSEHVDEIIKEYENLAVLYLERIKKGKPFRFYHFNINLYNGPCLYKRITSCGAGTEYFAVTPEGDFYPCHQFVGDNGFKIGDLDSGFNNEDLRKKFEKVNVFTKPECDKCWAKFYCSGGCPANAYYSNGEITLPEEKACEMQRKRIECAIMIEVSKALEKE